MRLSVSSYYAQISVAIVLLGVVGANSITERGSAAPADEHAVLVDNIGTYRRKISTKYEAKVALLVSFRWSSCHRQRPPCRGTMVRAIAIA